MKSMKKQIAIGGLSAVCALSLAAGVGIMARSNAFNAYAETTEVPSSVYYYDNLTDSNGKEYTLAKKFYEALDKMNKDGDFKDGIVDYSISSIVTSSQIEAWVEKGDLTIPKAFSAARDSYYYDHPELFYVDLYKLTISAGRTNGVYSAYIDCGREANCYSDGGFNNQNEVNNAIKSYNAKVNEIIAYAREEAAKLSLLDEKDALAESVNTYIAEHVDYDYDAYYDYLESEGDVYAGAFTYNAYGALVIGKSVCSGYARAYKAVLDQLEIPCVVVSGYSLSKAGDGSDVSTGEAHSWNYIWLADISDDGIAAQDNTVKGGWYAYDVTWNSARSNPGSYVNMDALANSRVHVSDPVVSTSNYAMPYPELSLNSYGNTTVNNEFMHSYIYEVDKTAGGNGFDDYGNPFMSMTERVSYKGKSAQALLEENLHIIYRFYYENNDGNMVWTNWTDLGVLDKNLDSMLDEGDRTVAMVDSRTLYSQYAVVDIEADLGSDHNVLPPEENRGEYDFAIYYSNDFKDADGKDLGEHTLYISELYLNKTYGTYMPAPYITTTNPAHTGTIVISDNMAVSAEDSTMSDKYTFTLNVTYDEKLEIIDKSQPIGINYVNEFNNIYEHSSLVPFETGEYVKLSADGYTLSFKFKPSLMYEHNSILYSFYFDNVGSTKTLNGKVSHKAPNPVHYHFARNFTCCPQILGGGRLWIDCCAQPTLVSNSDLAAMDFLDEEGNSTFSESARSQMMLVVNSPKAEEQEALMDGINENFGVTENDIENSETYDISLQICGKYPTIADGSYVKIALGFPAGYGPDDEGVTFKLYHRKHVTDNGKDEYIIEEVPCVVTKLGIVATVTSFSPYMVAAVKSEAVADNTDKYVYATIDGKGGTLSKEDGQIKTVKQGNSVTYTVKPDDGYMIYTVTLNDKNITDKVVDGKLTLSYDELADNNEIEIRYIANAAAQRYMEKGIEEPIKVVVSTEGTASTVEGTNIKVDLDVTLPSNNTLAIVLSIVSVAVALACVAVFVVVLRKRNKAKDDVQE